MASFQIPVTNQPQQFEIPLAGNSYTVTCRWCEADDGGWMLDFADALTGNPIVSSIPLVAGINLLAGLEYLGFGGELFVYTDGKPLSPPTYTNLGTECNLYFVTVD